MAGIVRILEEHSTLAAVGADRLGVGAPVPGNGAAVRGTGARVLGYGAEPPGSGAALPGSNAITSGNGSGGGGGGRATRRPFPFGGASLPARSPRNNAVHITRELVSTFLITHPHLDHLSGFVINTACFNQPSRPKRVAALPSTIEAMKTHIFNDIIWPNLSDEDGGVGLLTYQRLPEAAVGYVEVSMGLSVQVWPVSHGHCMKSHSHRGSQSNQVAGGPQKKACVYDSAVFFIRDDATKKEVMMWGDVEPDSISLSPRNNPAWYQAAIKFHRGMLNTIFIECSFDSSQPDNALYGHLSPPHLIKELKSLAQMVIGLREAEEADRMERLKRKRMSHGYTSADPEVNSRRTENPNPPAKFLDEAHPRSAPYGGTRPGDGRGGLLHSFGPWSKSKPEREIRQSGISGLYSSEVSPKAVGPSPYDMIDPAVGPRTGGKTINPEDEIPEKIDFHQLPLKGLNLIVTHIKDTLQDDVNVPENIMRSLQRLEADQKLGCTFSLSEQGGTFYF